MIVLFFKTHRAEDPDALPEKMRLILVSHVKEGETPEEKERAERELAEFGGA